MFSWKLKDVIPKRFVNNNQRKNIKTILYFLYADLSGDNFSFTNKQKNTKTKKTSYK